MSHRQIAVVVEAVDWDRLGKPLVPVVSELLPPFPVAVVKGEPEKCAKTQERGGETSQGKESFHAGRIRFSELEEGARSSINEC